jgi:hypothetical protein
LDARLYPLLDLTFDELVAWFRDRGIHARVRISTTALSRCSTRSPCTSTTGPRLGAVRTRAARCGRDARGTPIFAPTLPNDSLVWGGVQQMFIASFRCLALIVAEVVGVHAHSLVVNRDRTVTPHYVVLRL